MCTNILPKKYSEKMESSQKIESPYPKIKWLIWQLLSYMNSCGSCPTEHFGIEVDQQYVDRCFPATKNSAIGKFWDPGNVKYPVRSLIKLHPELIKYNNNLGDITRRALSQIRSLKIRAFTNFQKRRATDFKAPKLGKGSSGKCVNITESNNPSRRWLTDS